MNGTDQHINAKFRASFKRRQKYHRKQRANSLLYRDCEVQNIDDLQLFFRNVDYLRQQNKLTWQDIINDMESSGITLKRTYFDKLRRGERNTCNLLYLQFFCMMFGVRLGAMMSQDMGAMAAIKSADNTTESQPVEKKKHW